MFSELLLFSIIIVLCSTAIIHEGLNGLFSMHLLGFQLVEWVVKYLSVVAEELSKFLQVNLNNCVLVEQLSDDMEDVLECLSKDCFVQVG